VVDISEMTFPWDAPLPAIVEPPQAPAVMSTEDIVAALQRDFAYAVTHTAVQVRSPHEALQMLVNTPRGQIIPRGECKFTDGTTMEFQDIGMPQIGASLMTVKDLMARVWEAARELGLELKQ
jgi:hypothetical protein